MAQNYTRQSSMADGDTITAALFNNEYNQLVNAFAYSSSSASSTGHRHDGSSGQGGNIPQIGDLDFLNKVVVDGTNNRVGFFVEVSSSAVEQVRIQDGAIVPVTDNDIDLGTSSLEFKDGYFDGTVYADAINFNGTAITSTAAELNILDGVTSTAAEINLLDGVTATTTELNYNDTGASVGTVVASKVVTVDANKDVASFRNITLTGELDAGSLDISGDADIDGTLETDALSINGTAVTSTAAELNILDGATVVVGEINALDLGSTAVGTAIASKAVILDSSKDYTGIRNLTITGELDAATLDISGNVDVDGTLETDALSINGTVVTSTAAELNILDGVTSTAAELNILDGVTASAADINLIDGITNGTVIASKAIITDSNKDITGGRNITISGELDAATLDISGDADIDGTLETDALSINGTAVTSTAAELNTLDGITAVVGELNALDLGSTAVGTAIASKAVILDSNKDYTGIRNFTISGELDAATLDISGDIDVDGTTNLDVVDIDGAVDMASTLTVGGNVGIGTTSPSTFTGFTNLTIQGGSNGANLDFFNSSGTRKGAIVLDSSGNVTTETTEELSFKTGSSLTERMRIASGGGVEVTTSGVAMKAPLIQPTNGDVSSYTGTTPSMHSPASATLAFSMGGGERIRIDSSGDLLVNTTEAWGGETTPHIETRGDVAGDYAGVVISNTNDAASDSASLNFGLARDGGLVFGNAGKITVGKEQDWTTTASTVDGFMSFSTMQNESLTEAMRIDSSGNLLLATTTTGGTFSVVRNGNTYNINAVSDANNTTEGFFRGYSTGAGADRVIIYSNGNIVNANNSYGALSDLKLKENIVDSGSQWDDVKSVRVRKYSMKVDQVGEANQLGVIAQELESSGLTNLVYESIDRDIDGTDLGTTTKQVKYSILYMKAVKALQEAMYRIETLESKVQQLGNN